MDGDGERGGEEITRPGAPAPAPAPGPDPAPIPTAVGAATAVDVDPAPAPEATWTLLLPPTPAPAAVLACDCDDVVLDIPPGGLCLDADGDSDRGLCGTRLNGEGCVVGKSRSRWSRSLVCRCGGDAVEAEEGS
jgi:hypothetical protein